ncbi:MAG TPA: UDP-N-acetylenolpyruvoylglucosamine reductase, partial [Azospira sp.]|nr:UDP-N-acetylenolpyruvoylglucosamine reductase [Azospira sp.]
MLPSFLQADADLQPLNTLALPGKAAFLATIQDAAQLAALAPLSELQGKPRFILGGGSNLVLQGDFPGQVLRMAIPGRELAAED